MVSMARRLGGAEARRTSTPGPQDPAHAPAPTVHRRRVEGRGCHEPACASRIAGAWRSRTWRGRPSSRRGGRPSRGAAAHRPPRRSPPGKFSRPAPRPLRRGPGTGRQRTSSRRPRTEPPSVPGPARVPLGVPHPQGQATAGGLRAPGEGRRPGTRGSRRRVTASPLRFSSMTRRGSRGRRPLRRPGCAFAPPASTIAASTRASPCGPSEIALAPPPRSIRASGGHRSEGETP